ncbi:MAG: DUF3352 domain-containing protein [Oscillatoriales cyanobacterium SM2_1_8]|nr:DUF3352 domain-containing protein [Oscillatoriales cyanobacterium SM2_1_8]
MAVAATLVLVGIAVVAGVRQVAPGNLAAGVPAQPAAVKFLPKQAPLMVALTVSPDRLVRYGLLQVGAGERARLRQRWQETAAAFAQIWGLDYGRDIAPWQGDEFTVAVTTADLDRDPSNGLQPGQLLAVQARQEGAAAKALAALWQRQTGQGADLRFEPYQGLEIVAAQMPNRPMVAGAQVGSFVLFANDPQVIRGAIDHLQVPDVSLDNDPNFRAAVARLESPHIGVARVNGVTLADWGIAQHLLPVEFAKLPPTDLVLGLGVAPQGVRLETLALLAEPIPSAVGEPLHPAKLPARASFAVGKNLGATWTAMSDVLRPYPPLAQTLTQGLAQVDRALGFAATAEVFPWVQGDFALATLPNGTAAPHWLLSAAITDAKAAETGLIRLEEIARDVLGVTVGQIEVQGQPLTVWTRLQADGGEVRGEVVTAIAATADRLLWADSVEAIAEALAPTAQAPKLTPEVRFYAQAIAASIWLGGKPKFRCGGCWINLCPRC